MHLSGYTGWVILGFALILQAIELDFMNDIRVMNKGELRYEEVLS
jgi:hypothetical protein